jgi:hypothetical protein
LWPISLAFWTKIAYLRHAQAYLNPCIGEHITKHIIQFLDTFWHFLVTLLESYIAQNYSHVSGAGGDLPASSQMAEFLPFRHAPRYFSRWLQLIDSRGCL